MEIEEVAATHPEKIIKVAIDPVTGLQAFHARQIAFGLGLTGGQVGSAVKFLTAMYNAFVGLILVSLATMVLADPKLGNTGNIRTRADVVGYAAIGLTFLCGPVLSRLRPGLLPRLMVLDGALFVCLAIYVAGDGVSWALRAAANASFRYAPGVTLVTMIYGALQLSKPGDDSEAVVRRRRRLRHVALITGNIGEAVVAATLLGRAFRS